MAKIGNIFASAYGAVTKVVGGLWTRFGGQGWTRFRFLLPGSRFDYEREAGDLWQNPVVGLAIDWLGNRFPRPLIHVSKIAQRNGDGYKVGDYVPVGRHPFIDLWNRPNPFYNRRTMEKAIGLSLKVDGNAYLYKVRSNGGKLIELWWIPHYRILPTWPSDGSEYLDGYRIWLDNYVYWLPAKEIVHIRDGIDPRNERLGLCALRSCIREVCTINEESGYRAAILRNSGVPSLAIIPDSDALRPRKEDADEIRDRFGEHFGGDNRGKPAILGGPYKIERIGFSPEQMNLVQLPEIPTARILSSLGVAPMSLGLPDPGKTYSNLTEANRMSWGSIVSTQELVADSLRWQLLPEFGADPFTTVIEYDYTHVQELREDLDAVHDRTRKDYAGGLITRNEAREIVGFEPDPDGDVYFPGTGGEAEPKTTQQIQVQEENPVTSQDVAEGTPVGLQPAPSRNGDSEKAWRWRY